MLNADERWGYVKGDVNYISRSPSRCSCSPTQKRMKELDQKPRRRVPQVQGDGREFDPGRPDDYVKGFAIRKAA